MQSGIGYMTRLADRPCLKPIRTNATQPIIRIETAVMYGALQCAALFSMVALTSISASAAAVTVRSTQPMNDVNMM